MSSSSSECKQGWMPQFSSSACTLWWSLTTMCAKCFTPSLFTAKTRKVTSWLSEGRLKLQPFPFTSLPGGLSCSGWLSDFQWLSQQNLFSRRASKPTQAFLLHGERHKHQIVSFLSRNMQCQRMKHQILYSWLRLISVIRKENPLAIWNRNCLNSEPEHNCPKELDCLIQVLVWTSHSWVRRKAHWRQLLQLALQAAEL